MGSPLQQHTMLAVLLSGFLLHSAIQSIRGAQSLYRHAIKIPAVVDIVNVNSNISFNVSLMNTNLFLSFLPACPSRLPHLYLFLQLYFHPVHEGTYIRFFFISTYVLVCIAYSCCSHKRLPLTCTDIVSL